MAGGRIVERGAHRDLIAADTLYRRMFGAAELEGTTLDAAEPAAGAGRRAPPAPAGPPRPPPRTVRHRAARRGELSGAPRRAMELELGGQGLRELADGHAARLVVAGAPPPPAPCGATRTRGLTWPGSGRQSGPHGSGADLHEFRGWRAFVHLARELKLSRLARLVYPYRGRAALSHRRHDRGHRHRPGGALPGEDRHRLGHPEEAICTSSTW